ncbi:MAG: HAMP domain-containing sensor histidine kinase [Polaribacter sp.]|jgi:two-component system, sporulation sensor kinase D|nr:HAMP domain-containing sensor histidine kinase [Polaribacter sp.]MDG1954402.1 HAMP domain-containing sensor histidine kinase [Polaribacter sp.]MDG2073146.1 HAMP domain-containing sensor histidine kinase [Polaribacter sp.]
MNFFKNTILTKRIVIFVLFIIVSLILWNTYVFFQKFKQEERAKMEILASAIKELATNTDLNASVNLETKIFENITNIPSIQVNKDGTINSWRNLDSTKTHNPTYLQSQLAIMRNQNEPIEINYLDVTEYVYYKDSDLLDKLTYYPIALILILFLFLAVIYMLFSSNKIAEQNRLWTGMAKETAHQIGTPLSSLLGWIAILKAENISEKYVDEIENDVNRLNIIANRFSKIGSAPELKKQNIVSITKKSFEYLESRSSKQISFQFTSEKEELFSNLNIELFGWVIENLTKNSIDAMKGKGSVSLDISENNKAIKITITDSGKGIQKSQFKQIFKPGFTTKKRGWGLGLSLSKRIVEEYHNGKIFVKKSEINKGTSIQILLQRV